MTASEARSKLNKKLAQESVKRVFPLIEKAIENKQNSITLKIALNGDIFSDNRLTRDEFDILKSYGYTLIPITDDSGDYYRSDKLIGYEVTW
jgi:hypothetical protein